MWSSHREECDAPKEISGVYDVPCSDYEDCEAPTELGGMCDV